MAAPGDAIFAAAESLFDHVRAAAAFTSMLAESGDSPANDAEVREIVSPAVSAVLYVFDQLLAPSRDEADAIVALTACAKRYAERRAKETAEIAVLGLRGAAMKRAREAAIGRDVGRFVSREEERSREALRWRRGLRAEAKAEAKLRSRVADTDRRAAWVAEHPSGFGDRNGR